jgi:hypothetical protein
MKHVIILIAAVILAQASRGALPEHLKEPGLAVIYRLTDNIYAGSAPEGDAGFISLKKLGVKTIITVDGTKPDIATARKHGFHYIHLPHGYDGISTNTQVALIKAAETVPGPIYVHCHHGLHRGPTAAAVICMGTAGWTPEQGLKWLKQVGTSTNYVGLYKTVETFRPPSKAALEAAPDHFPEVAKTEDLINTMVAIDGQWDKLKEIRKAGYEVPKDSPDLIPTAEATLLREHFREARRLPESRKRGVDFIKHFKAAEETTAILENDLGQYESKQMDKKRLESQYKKLEQTCAACHKIFRNPTTTQLPR